MSIRASIIICGTARLSARYSSRGSFLAPETLNQTEFCLRLEVIRCTPDRTDRFGKPTSEGKPLQVIQESIIRYDMDTNHAKAVPGRMEMLLW